MLIFVYCSSYLKTDVHAVGEYEVAKEGFLSSFALFLVKIFSLSSSPSSSKFFINL